VFFLILVLVFVVLQQSASRITPSIKGVI